MFDLNYNIDINFISYMTDNTSNTTSASNNSSYTGTPTDGVIMATALAGGMKAAQTQPTVAGPKDAAVAAITLAAGATAISIKNIAGNLSSEIGKSKSKFMFNSENSNENIANMLNISLTGNDLYDLLQFIHLINLLTLISVAFAFYYFFISRIDVEWIVKRLNKIITNTLVLNYLTRFINYTKKSSSLLMFLFLILVFSCCYISYYYTGFI